MEIAIIGTRGYPSTYGGFETFVRRFAPFAAEQGATVRVYGRGQAADTTHVGAGTIRTLNTPGLDSMRLSTLSYGLTSSLHAASRRRPDVALVMNVANGFWLPILRARGIPTAVNVDGLEWERAKWSRLGRSVFLAGAHLTARAADSLIADSGGIAQYWSTRWNCSPVFIPYGADVPATRSPLPDVVRGLSADKYLLIVARLVPENNVDFLLDALEHLGHAVPTVVVGSGQEDALTQRLRRLDQSIPHFNWLGHVSDQSILAALWQNAGLYLHGHSVGGTNPALLQALGHGAPTLALNTVFNAEVVDDPAQLFELDAPALADRIAELMKDASSRADLAERGQKVIRSRYNWDDVNRAYLDLLTGLAARPTR